MKGAPTNRGFARLAWLGPIVILLVGSWMVVRYLRQTLAGAESKNAAFGGDPGMRARIEEELKARRS